MQFLRHSPAIYLRRICWTDLYFLILHYECSSSYGSERRLWKVGSQAIPLFVVTHHVCNELAPKRAKPDSKLQKRPTKFLLSDLQFCIIAVQVPFPPGMLFRERVYKFAKHVFAVLPGWAVKVSFSSKALF